MRKILNFIFVFIVCLNSGYAQINGISLESKVDRSKITIGDRIRYSIVIQRGDSVLVEMPEVGANLGTFEILGYEDPEPGRMNEMILERREYIISTFEIGEFEIPPVTIRFMTKPDTLWQELSTEKIQVQVESLKPSEAGDIRDIKIPLEIQRDIKKLVQLAVASAALLLLALLLFYFIRRRKQGKSILPKKEKTLRPAHEIALEYLDALIASDLLERGKIKQFYIELSDIIRSYIEGRFFIIALEMTTGQLIDNMQQDELDNNVIDVVSRFLDNCDLVKFAKYIPSSGETDDAVKQAYELIDLTKIEMKSENTGDVESVPTKVSSEFEPEEAFTEAEQGKEEVL